MPFFFNATAPTEIYTLSLHDALPICAGLHLVEDQEHAVLRGELPDPLEVALLRRDDVDVQDRKSTRLNSSHMSISYAVFCLKKKKKYATQECPRKPHHSDHTTAGRPR